MFSIARWDILRERFTLLRDRRRRWFPGKKLLEIVVPWVPQIGGGGVVWGRLADVTNLVPYEHTASGVRTWKKVEAAEHRDAQRP